MLESMLRDHLVRLAALSVLSLAVGAALAVRSGGEAKHGFGTMTAGWALVNLIIVAASWTPRAPVELGPMREFLTFNLGLNIAYIATGATVANLSPKPFSRGMGFAVVIQGLILLALDGVLYARLPGFHSS